MCRQLHWTYVSSVHITHLPSGDVTQREVMRERKKPWVISSKASCSPPLSLSLSFRWHIFCRRVIKEEDVIKKLVGQLAWLVVYLCTCMLCWSLEKTLSLWVSDSSLITETKSYQSQRRGRESQVLRWYTVQKKNYSTVKMSAKITLKPLAQEHMEEEWEQLNFKITEDSRTRERLKALWVNADREGAMAAL